MLYSYVGPRPSSSSYEKAMHTWTMENQRFLQGMQESQNQWAERHQERRQQREERLMERFMEESARSNERLVSEIFQGLRSILPQNPFPPRPYPSQMTFQHIPVHGYNSPSPSSQNNPGSSDYSLHDMDGWSG